MKQNVKLVIGLVMTMILAACMPRTLQDEGPVKNPSAQLTRIKACTSATSQHELPILYALEHGLFEKYGLDVDLTTIPGGTNATTALIAGEVSICQIAGPAVVNANLAGENLVFVGGVNNQQPYWLVVRPEIQTPEDLKGTVMGLASIGGSSDTILRRMLESLGITPDVDVTLVVVGNLSERLAALESGQISGTVLQALETAQAQRLGHRVLLAPEQVAMQYPASAIVVQRYFLAENRAAVTAFVQAVTEAIAAMKRDPNSAKTFLGEALDLDPIVDTSVIDLVYDHLILESIPERPYPAREGIQQLIDSARLENPSLPELTADDMIDNSVTAELEQSGFFNSLYQP